jgi:hypothetical protein
VATERHHAYGSCVATKGGVQGRRSPAKTFAVAAALFALLAIAPLTLARMTSGANSNERVINELTRQRDEAIRRHDDAKATDLDHKIAVARAENAKSDDGPNLAIRVALLGLGGTLIAGVCAVIAAVVGRAKTATT